MNNDKLNGIKDQVARESDYKNWFDVHPDDEGRYLDKICERYAASLTKDLYTRSEVEASIKASLEMAAQECEG